MYIGGIGGFLIQAIIGFLVAIPIALTIYRGKVKEWRNRGKKMPEVSETQQED